MDIPDKPDREQGFAKTVPNSEDGRQTGRFMRDRHTDSDVARAIELVAALAKPTPRELAEKRMRKASGQFARAVDALARRDPGADAAFDAAEAEIWRVHDELNPE